MRVQFRDRITIPAKKSNCLEKDPDCDEPPKKKGKVKNYYGQILLLKRRLIGLYFSGVENDKFLGRKPSATAIAEISGTSEEDSFKAREAIFESRRAEIQYKLRLVD